jgi:acyl-CoA synthetase (AMP-forming)/AMP-acid ligase II
MSTSETGSTSRHVPDGEHYDPSADAAGTLPNAWKRHWERAPDRVQLHDPERGWLTRGALDSESQRIAGRLAAAGYRTGDRILLSARASAALVCAHVACLRLGLVVLPTNTAYQMGELEHVDTMELRRICMLLAQLQPSMKTTLIF